LIPHMRENLVDPRNGVFKVFHRQKTIAVAQVSCKRYEVSVVGQFQNNDLNNRPKGSTRVRALRAAGKQEEFR
jgi:hypothetical protein